jgi:hypothetical protein
MASSYDTVYDRNPADRFPRFTNKSQGVYTEAGYLAYFQNVLILLRIED